MRFLIVDGDYQEFLRLLYGSDPRLRNLSYDQQVRARADSLQGVADFYSSNLRQLGQEVSNVWVNNEIIQRTWARENGVRP